MSSTRCHALGLAVVALAAVVSAACDGGGASSSSPPSSTTPPATSTPTPQPPASVSVPRVILGRPTDASISSSVMGDAGTEVFLEFGTAAGTYTGSSQRATLAADTPAVVVAGGLAPNTRYYYRVRYRAQTDADFRAGTERTFHTQRLQGSTFTFVVQADPHMDENSSGDVYVQTLANELGDGPDLLFDLGDTSMSEKCAIDGPAPCAAPSPATAEKVWARNALMRSYFDLACHSVPLFMALGNHDGENGWQDAATAATVGAWSIAARKALFLNPEPDGFYSGSSQPSGQSGLRQNYYAFTWGDALFVVLDPFTYTTKKPVKGQAQDSWNWTLGQAQYQWLASTLAGSRARFKFVFTHHLVGGNGAEARGGSEFGRFYEWGGRDLDGTWAFDKQRPGWGKPIHQLFVDHKVTAWFHGHDHLYAMEQLDGVIYQEVPQPSLARYDTQDPGKEYGYKGTVGSTVFPSPGHLRVTVSPADVRVEYVRSVAPADETATRKNGTIVASYVVR